MTMQRAAVARAGWRLPRQPGDVFRVAIAVVVLVVSAVFVHRHRVGVFETDVFRVVNDLPAALFVVVWPIMQAGTLFAAPAAAAVAAATRRFRLALELLVAGGGVWLLAKVVKGLIVRGRPASLLPDVHIHGAAAAGRGYLSGHAAVAAAIVTLVAPYLGRRARLVLIGLAVVVGLGRVYVGAHLPLDVVGGAALGWGSASAVHLLLGAPSGRPSPSAVRRALRSYRLSVAELTLVDVDADGSARFLATTPSGDRLRVKVIPRERRDRDLVYRAWLALRRPRSGRPARSPGHEAEREALLAVAARAAGVDVAPVLAVGSCGRSSGLLVQRWVDGRDLADAHLDDAVLHRPWRSLGLLHSVGIAYGDAPAQSVVVDDGRRCWFVDFSRAELRMDEAAYAADVAAFLVLLGRRHDPGATVATARAGVGEDAVTRALALPRDALGPSTRLALAREPELWPTLTASARHPDATTAAVVPPARAGH
jgi:undecaprenyl-diphosphatase